MSLTFSTSAKNARADAITAAIGTGGKLKFFHSDGTTVLVTDTFTGNMFAAASGGAIAFNAPATNPVGASATGTLTTAKITTSADVDVITGLTVGTSGTDIIVDNTSIASGQQFTWNYGSSNITEA
jgi:hypothetical protein